MKSEILKTFESLDKKYGELLRHLDSLTAETLYFKAGPDKWSIAEVVEHLVIAEDALLRQLSGANSAPKLDPGERSLEKYQTVIKVMEKDIPVEVPDESLEPHGHFTLEELLDRWDDIRKKIRVFLGGINPEDENDLVYHHPFAGPLNMAETLRFVEVHFDNHMRHINKIKAQVFQVPHRTGQ